MLQQNAVPSATLELLKTICSISELESFGLGGGTSLALRMGHRFSIDMDSLPILISIPVQFFKLSQKKFPQQSYCLNKIKP
jgi:hypothetical protein